MPVRKLIKKIQQSRNEKSHQRELLKGLFCHQNVKKAERLSMKFSSAPNTNMQQVF